MVGGRDAAYRLRVAGGFLEEMRQDAELAQAQELAEEAVSLASSVVSAPVGPTP